MVILKLMRMPVLMKIYLWNFFGLSIYKYNDFDIHIYGCEDCLMVYLKKMI